MVTHAFNQLCKDYSLLCRGWALVSVSNHVQEHNAVSVPALQRQDGDTTVSGREIRLSRSLFADVFRLILCWIPSSIIIILTRYNFTETMFNSYAISLWISQIPSIPSSAQEWIPCSEENFGEYSVGKEIGDTLQASTASTADATRRFHQDQKQSLELGDFGCRRANENWWKTKQTTKNRL